METVEDIRTYIRQHEERWIDELHPLTETPSRLLGQNGLVILQRILGRSLSLTKAIDKSVKEKNIISLAIAIRAHFETVGILALLYKKFSDFYSSKCTFEELEEQLRKGFLGAKLKYENADFQTPDPIHILTGLGKADSYFKSIGGEHKYFRDGYDLLCEFTHPNFLGTAFCTNVQDGFVHFLNQNDSYVKYKKSIMPQMHISQLAFFHVYDVFLQELSKNEQLPIIIKHSENKRDLDVPVVVKEEDLFHTGTTSGEIKIKHVYLKDMHCFHPHFQKMKKEIRALLRCQDNLKMVYFDLVSFVAKYYGRQDDPNLSFELEPRAILSHCLMNYRACFVLGEGNEKPLGFLDQALLQAVIHQKIRILSDKLIGHLDSDSEVRRDTVHWDFEMTENGLLPVKPQNLFSKVLSLHKDEILEWQEHISQILEEIEIRLGMVAKIINNKIELKS